MAGYDPQRGRARPRIGADAPAAVDGLLGATEPEPAVEEVGGTAEPTPVEPAATEAAPEPAADGVTAEPVADGAPAEPAAAEAAPEPAVDEATGGLRPAPAGAATEVAAADDEAAAALREALAEPAGSAELVVVGPAGRTPEGLAVGSPSVGERRSLRPNPVAVVVFLAALVAAVLLALRLRRRRG